MLRISKGANRRAILHTSEGFQYLDKASAIY